MRAINQQLADETNCHFGDGLRYFGVTFSCLVMTSNLIRSYFYALDKKIVHKLCLNMNC